MNVLLTGGAGYIGSHTCVALVEAGYSVVIFDNFCNSSPSVIQRLEAVLGKPVAYVEGDVRNTELLQKTMEHHSIDAVIHFAGLKAVGESVQLPLDYYENNVQGTLSLLRAMLNLGLKKLVFSSSATVYGDPEYLPIDEAHPLDPQSPYGQTKLQIEEILRDVAKADQDWKIAVLRYFNPTGAHPSGLLGERPQGVPNNLMPYIAQVASGKLSELKVFGNDYPTQDGTGVRDYLHVLDLAEGHLAALAYLDQTQGIEIFNLGTGQGYSVLQMMQTYEEACGKKIPYKMVSRRPGDIASCYASIAKANQVLAWSARRSLLDMCKSSWAFESQSQA
jgi:UDP-glucose 4-epimerase